MLTIILVISLLHLAWMNSLMYGKANASLCYLSAGLPMLSVCMMIMSGVLVFQVFAMIVLVIVCRRWTPDRPSVFLASSSAAVVLGFGVAALHTLSHQRDLLDRYPMESMSERVPIAKVHLPPASDRKSNHWKAFEGTIEVKIDEGGYRTSYLRSLHEEKTRNFVNSAGFGVGRMPRTLELGNFESMLDPDQPVYQPGPAEPAMLSTEILEKPQVAKNLDTLRTLHFDAMLDFANIKGFGYIKDREHVAGFVPHQFSKMPIDNAVRIQRLELVSLLMNSQPVVYVSKELPRMKDLKKAPTRPLSEFEAMGLESLIKGEDLFVREADSTIHMLGAIRSVSQCLKCHGGDRGDLLGAFSYFLQK